MDAFHLEEGEGGRARGDVQREDADENEGRPEEEIQGQLHRRVFLRADTRSPEGPAEDALRADLARGAPDADQEVHRQHGDLVEEKEDEEVERDEDAVDTGDEEQQEGVELLPALLDRPRGEDAREDDDAGQEHQEQAHAVHPQLVGDAERRHQRHLFVELEARRLALVGRVDPDREHERDGRGDERDPAHEEGAVAGQEHDEDGAHEGRPGDDGQRRESFHRGHRIQTISRSTPSAMP